MLRRGERRRRPRPETAFLSSFLYALAATLLLALVRHLLGNQICNCALLALLWATAYRDLSGPRRPRGHTDRS